MMSIFSIPRVTRNVGLQIQATFAPVHLPIRPTPSPSPSLSEEVLLLIHFFNSTSSFLSSQDIVVLDDDEEGGTRVNTMAKSPKQVQLTVVSPDLTIIFCPGIF